MSAFVFRESTVLFVRFNKKPKKGIQYLQDQGLVGNRAEDVAELFHNDERLDKVGVTNMLLFKIMSTGILDHRPIWCMYKVIFILDHFIGVSSGTLHSIVYKVGEATVAQW